MAKGYVFSVGKFRFWAIIILGLFLINTSCSREQETLSESVRSKLIQPPKWWEQLPRSIYLKFDKVQTNQSWYEVYILRENTYAIYEPY